MKSKKEDELELGEQKLNNPLGDDNYHLSSAPERKKQRFHYLYKVYEATIQSEEKGLNQDIDKYEIGKALNLNPNMIDSIVKYLEEEGLVHNLGIHSRAYTGRSENSKIAITHDGIDEVEDALERPASPTQHFPAYSVSFNIGGDYVGRDKAAGDIAGRDIYKSQGNMTINQNQIGELKDIIAELRKIQGQPELPDEKKEELEAEIQTIESQTKSPKPKTQIIKDALSSAKGIIE